MFIYLLTVLGLCCCVGFFSSCGEWGLLSSCGAWTSHCSDFSCYGAWALGHVGSGGVAPGLSTCGSWPLEYRLSSCGSWAWQLWLLGSVLVAPGLSTCGSWAQQLWLLGSVLVAPGLSTYGSWAQYLWLLGSAVVAPGLQSIGSVVLAHGLSYPGEYGIFPDPGSNPCPLHWQVDSDPLYHQGNP